MIFSIKQRIITGPDQILIGDNADYIAHFEFDDEWKGSVKTARFSSQLGYVEELLEDNQCAIPKQLLKKGIMRVGVFDDVKATTFCEIHILESILERDGQVVPPSEDIYSQIIALIEKGVTPEQLEIAIEEYFKTHPIPSGGITREECESIVSDYAYSKAEVDRKISQIPKGVEIDDSKASTSTTYSSQKITDFVADEVGKKQDKLVSGTNIKTINGNPILGSGNIIIEGDGSSSRSVLDVFMDNVDVDYEFDATSNANYTVIRIYKDKLDGTKQYPFVYAPNGSESGDKSTYDMIMEDGFCLAINSGVFNTANIKPDGIVIQNSTVVQNTPSSAHNGCKPLTIDRNGNLGYANADANASTLVSSGIVSAVCGFMPIIVDYEAVPSSEWNNVSHYTENAQRQIIGQFGNGDYAIVTCEGRNYQHSDGWTIAEAQEVCKRIGLKFAYNLDGGGSTETMLGKKAFNTIYEGTTGRKVPTFIVFNGTNTFDITPPTPTPPESPTGELIELFNDSNLIKARTVQIDANAKISLGLNNARATLIYNTQSSSYSVNDLINGDVVKGKTITITCPATYNSDAVYFGVQIFNSNGARILDSGWNQNSYTFTTTSDAFYLGLNIGVGSSRSIVITQEMATAIKSQMTFTVS